MSIQIITLFLATMTTGLMAGIFFTWTNAVTPGIGKLKDLEYLSALQSMNRVILNPIFYIVFICPILALPLATVLNYNSASSLVFTLLLIASAIYLLGVFIITVAGNIPLNRVLDKTNLDNFNLEDAENLRNEIETKWNNFNLIRTITSSTSFILLILICFLIT
ncbi:MAG: anthrone oxygenase family protein [Methylococcaceae bacterium]